VIFIIDNLIIRALTISVNRNVIFVTILLDGKFDHYKKSLIGECFYGQFIFHLTSLEQWK